MGIDEALFAEKMGDLDEHYYGDRPDGVLATYYELLNPRLDNESFRRACRHLLWDRAAGEGFPAASEVVEAATAGPDPAERAVEQTEILREMMKDWRRAEPEERLDPVGQRALDAVGGIKELSLLPREKANWRLKEFRSQYRALAAGQERERAALPETTERGERLVRDAMDGTLSGDAGEDAGPRRLPEGGRGE